MSKGLQEAFSRGAAEDAEGIELSDTTCELPTKWWEDLRLAASPRLRVQETALTKCTTGQYGFVDKSDHRGHLGMTERRRSWSVADARAHLSKVIERDRSEGPQAIFRRGRRTAILVSAEEWDRKTHRKGSLVDFLAASPLRASGLRIKRIGDRPRKLDL